LKPNKKESQMEKHPVVLLIIDMLNTLDFPQGDKLAKASLPVAKNIAKLKRRFKSQGWPVVYVNDNFGKWQSSRTKVFETCSAEESRGRKLAHILKPDEDDFFILKPRHSAFYSTNLEILLRDFNAKSLVLTGIAGNICVLFTANDAHMRGYKLWVPQDCVASNTTAENSFAIKQVKNIMKARTANSASVLLTEI
jgi:nicotinamidase-related amidase